MKIGFYNPYYDSLGGGERYVLTLAGYWGKTHDVSIFWNDDTILKKAQERFHLDLSNVKVVSNIFQSAPFIRKFFLSSQYDLLFFLSDGSVPFSLAKKNVIIFQAPFPHISYPLWKRMRYQAIVVYSKFAKRMIDPSVGKYATVIYPPVDSSHINVRKKTHTILSVGRFSSFFRVKKQEVLIDIFCEGIEKDILRDWRLVLAGGLLPSDKKYFEMLQAKTKELPIELLPNCSFGKLKEEYERASIYWHGAGFGETNPERMEHFGITTVEAMAAGCIPIVYNAGGQPEIIDHTKNGFLWNTKEECLDLTNFVIHSSKLQKELQRQARVKATEFSTSRFFQQFDELLGKIN